MTDEDMRAASNVLLDRITKDLAQPVPTFWTHKEQGIFSGDVTGYDYEASIIDFNCPDCEADNRDVRITLDEVVCPECATAFVTSEFFDNDGWFLLCLYSAKRNSDVTELLRMASHSVSVARALDWA